MNRYKVYFELFGKKMVTEVDASNEHDAEEVIREKIVFYKTECIHHSDTCKKDPFDIPDILKRMLGL